MPTPQSNQLPIKPDEIVGILLRYRWLVVVPLCITLTVGLYRALTIPRVYSASTTILVQGQKVPGSYVKSIVTSGIDERINTISQQILSQSNLEKIIGQFGLFQERKYQKLFLEDKIKNLRGRINVNLTRDRKGTDAFTIRYRGTNPERVMNITNTLAGLYMDENLKLREAQAVGTSEFLEAELEKTRKKLVEKERILSSYRSKYMGGLPDELESNLRTLDRLQQQLTDRQAMLRETRNNIAALKARMAQDRELEAQAKEMLVRQMTNSSGDPQPLMSDTATRLARAELELEELRLRYTEKHPDVVKLHVTIKRLKQLLAKESEQPSRAEAAGETDTFSAVGGAPLTTKRVVDVQEIRQLQQLENEERQLQREISDITNRMKVYQRRVDETPRREQELRSLERDYSNIQEVYSSLMDRKLEAELSVNMEKKQKGEQFRILDRARLPQRPISPDVKKLFVFSTAAGLGVGGGIIFLLVFFDGSVRRDEDIEDVLGLPILATIAPLKRKQDRLRIRLELIGFIAMAGYGGVMLAGFGLLNLKGLDWVLAFGGRLGL